MSEIYKPDAKEWKVIETAIQAARALKEVNLKLSSIRVVSALYAQLHPKGMLINLDGGGRVIVRFMAGGKKKVAK